MTTILSNFIAITLLVFYRSSRHHRLRRVLIKLRYSPSTQPRRFLKPHIFIYIYFYTDSCGLGFKPLRGTVLKRCRSTNFTGFVWTEGRSIFKFIPFQKYPGSCGLGLNQLPQPKLTDGNSCRLFVEILISTTKKQLLLPGHWKESFTRILKPKTFFLHETSESALTETASLQITLQSSLCPGSCGQGSKTKNLSLTLEVAIWV